MTTEQSLGKIRVSDLTFDLKNPRLSEYEIGLNPTESEIVKLLWDTMDVRELVLSIEASGFFSHEPIIIAHEDGKAGIPHIGSLQAQRAI